MDAPQATPTICPIQPPFILSSSSLAVRRTVCFGRGEVGVGIGEEVGVAGVVLSPEGVLLPEAEPSETVVWLPVEIVGESGLFVPEVPLEQPASSNAEKASAASL